jgi:hypothetical protein
MEQKHSGFFDLPLIEQDKLKKAHPEWGEEYEILLYSSICKLKGKLSDLEELELDPFVELEFNKAKLKYYGVGKDNFQLVVQFDDGKTTLDYDSVLSFDKEGYDARVAYTQKILGTDAPPAHPYYLQLTDVYARAHVTGEDGIKEFKYVFLKPFSEVITVELEKTGLDKITELLPHGFERCTIGEKLSDCDSPSAKNILSYKVVAEEEGKEILIVKLREFTTELIQKYTNKVSAYLEDNDINKVIVKELEMEDGDEYFCYFTSSKVAEKVKLQDFEATLAPYKIDNMLEFKDLFETTLDEFEAEVIAEYERLLEDFDPSIKVMGAALSVQVQATNEELDALEFMAEESDLIEDILKNGKNSDSNGLFSIVDEEN